MIWKALIKLAVLGTDRGHLPEAVAADLKKLGVRETDSLARQVLQGAAIVHQMQKAGFPLLSYNKKLPAVAEIEGTRKCSSRSAHHLNLIIAGTYRSALGEFVTHLLENKRVFPPENLPVLFDVCLQNPTLWEKVRPVIGQTGEWLLGLNPDWAILTGAPDFTHWQTGNRQERVLFLQKMRQRDPAQALSLLQETWGESGIGEQKALLATLETGLTLEDEAFLEPLLDASRKEIRSIAADFLSKLEGSALVQRLFATLKERVLISEEKKFDILLPDKLAPDLKRDGIDPKKQPYPGGQKAGWIGQMIARVPPAFWEDHWQLSPQATLDLVEKSHWRKLFHAAITDACLRFHTPTWELALLQNWQKKEDQAAWTSATGRQLVQQLSDEDFNTLVLAQIKETGPTLAEDSLASHLVCLGKHWWNDEVALQIIRGFQSLITEADAYYWNLTHYRRILLVASYRCDVHLFDQFKKGWEYKSPVWPRWEKEVERFMRTLRFRMEMIAELQS